MTFEEDGIYYIRGIVSVGPSRLNRTTQTVECDSTNYVIFTDVAQYLPWIRDIASIQCETKTVCRPKDL